MTNDAGMSITISEEKNVCNPSFVPCGWAIAYEPGIPYELFHEGDCPL